MVDYQKLYVCLFQAITAALDELESLNIWSCKQILMEAQQTTEEMYISADE